MKAVLNLFDVFVIQPDFFNDADIDSRLDKKKIKDSILKRCGTLFPVYTDTRIFKYFSDVFFNEKKGVITKLIDTTEFEYDPIHNYDTTMERQDKHSGTDKRDLGQGGSDTHTIKHTGTDTDTQAHTGKDKDTTTKTGDDTLTAGIGNTVTNTPDLTTETQVSAFDSSSYQPDTKTHTTGTDTTDTDRHGSDITTYDTTTAQTLEYDSTNTSTKVYDTTNVDTIAHDTTGKDYITYDSSHAIQEHNKGNIGNITTQTLIEQERQVDLFSIYEWIAIEFEQNFCICVS